MLQLYTPQRVVETANQLKVFSLSRLFSCLLAFNHGIPHAYEVPYLLLRCPCPIYLSSLSSVSNPLTKLTAPAFTLQPLPPLDIHSLAIQSVVHEPVMGASWESSLEMQISGPPPDPLNQHLHFKETLRGCVCTLRSVEFLNCLTLPCRLSGIVHKWICPFGSSYQIDCIFFNGKDHFLQFVASLYNILYMGTQ